MKVNRLIALLVAVPLLFLAACGSPEATTSDDPPVDDPPPQDAAETTEDLSQTITSEDGSITISYPGSWAAEGLPGGVFLYNSQELMDNPPLEEIGANQLMGAVEVAPAANVVDLGLEEGASPLEILNVLYSPIQEDGVGQMDISGFDAGGKAAAIMTGGIAMDGQDADVIVVVVAVDAGYGVINFITSSGEGHRYEATARAIAGTFEYQPVAVEG
jgi:hypothetical protein